MYNGFSILIPTWNNLEYLKLCVRSIREHSHYLHQIIVHVNDGSDGTLDWVREQGLDYTYSEQNIGVCLAMNTMRRKVATEYICFLNDDMYVLPNWDKVLMDEISKLPDNKFYLSATMIQPHDANDVGLCINYGDSIDTFQEELLLKEYMKEPYSDWLGATRPPSLVHRDIWDLVGGYSIEYTPGMYSDPDFTAKLLLVGVKYMKGMGSSRVYHFETKTTARIKKNNGSLQFLLKWGISNSVMRKMITRQGMEWGGYRDVPINKDAIRMKKRFMRIKAMFYMLRHGFGMVGNIYDEL